MYSDMFSFSLRARRLGVQVSADDGECPHDIGWAAGATEPLTTIRWVCIARGQLVDVRILSPISRGCGQHSVVEGQLQDVGE